MSFLHFLEKLSIFSSVLRVFWEGIALLDSIDFEFWKNSNGKIVIENSSLMIFHISLHKAQQSIWRTTPQLITELVCIHWSTCKWHTNLPWLSTPDRSPKLHRARLCHREWGMWASENSHIASRTLQIKHPLCIELPSPWETRSNVALIK